MGAFFNFLFPAFSSMSYSHWTQKVQYFASSQRKSMISQNDANSVLLLHPWVLFWISLSLYARRPLLSLIKFHKSKREKKRMKTDTGMYIVWYIGFIELTYGHQIRKNFRNKILMLFEVFFTSFLPKNKQLPCVSHSPFAVSFLYYGYFMGKATSLQNSIIHFRQLFRFSNLVFWFCFYNFNINFFFLSPEYLWAVLNSIHNRIIDFQISIKFLKINEWNGH